MDVSVFFETPSVRTKFRVILRTGVSRTPIRTEIETKLSGVIFTVLCNGPFELKTSNFKPKA
jgi:hypothetical protein